MPARSPPVSPVMPEVNWPPIPPPADSELDRALRLEEEKEAKKRSDAIDHAIELEREEMRKQRHNTKIVLLGQAESGKSTMLKNFQLHFAPKAFQAETEAWRAVIHLNLVRSVNFILDLLRGGTSSGSNRFSPPASLDDLRPLRMRLSPLRQVEIILVKRLSVDNTSRDAAGIDDSTPWYYGRASEVSIRSGSGWKALLCRHRQQLNSHADELVSARQVLDACRDDIVTLWSNPTVHAGLRGEGVCLQEQSGFFLDEALRVGHIDYEPTYTDVLRARLQTIGVEEHHLTFERLASRGEKWIFYDVGGAREQRAAWVPYFEDVNAVIFLCPMSAFDEVLLEDRSVNRLLDSFNLWKTICSSKLLGDKNFILLLNKSDILKTKLESGVSFVRYVKSYNDEPNDAEHVSEYLKRKFVSMHRHLSPRRRHLHVHITCAIDISVMSAVLVRIREVIIMKNLAATDFL
ncbi:G-protein alpha subunit [Sparassis crispa]|uniref:G-protein alpha subunit n=1 Tax=Sparassis crispa TaxID=139825 RepID=A0A401GZE5_9APHY|nr:G-protein alpha subunit [Sparassis crispa]GBE87528.1 G-protein alpha subunit [Sparassis crispa]